MKKIYDISGVLRVKLRICVTLLMVLFLISAAFTVIGPVAAVQKGDLIDHGTKYTTSHAKCDWKTYWYSESTRKIVKSYYYLENNKWVFDFQYSVVLQKISSTQIKISSEDAGGINTYYVYTRLSTRDYYWNVYRSEWLEN